MQRGHRQIAHSSRTSSAERFARSSSRRVARTTSGEQASAIARGAKHCWTQRFLGRHVQFSFAQKRNEFRARCILFQSGFAESRFGKEGHAMKCTTVRSKLAGYLDDVVESAARTSERGEMRAHLDSCAYCREEVQRYRKLAILLSRSPRALPPSDLAVRIKVAAAQAQQSQDWRTLKQRVLDRTEILLDNVLRP